MKTTTTTIAAVVATLFYGASVSAEVGKADFQALDVNRDGVISADESQEHPDLMGAWTTLDINADGTLDVQEFANHSGMDAASQTGTAPKAMLNDGTAGTLNEVTNPGISATQQTGPAPKADFRTLDANGDGVISADEAQEYPDLMGAWATLDVNADGTLDVQEFENHQGLDAALQTGPAPTAESGS